MLRPDGLRSFVENWQEVATWMVRRLRAEAILEGSGNEAATLLKRVLELPGVAEIAEISHVEQDFPPTLVVSFRKDETRLSLFSMIATMGTPLDVSLQNLRLEMFFPADDSTAHWFARALRSD
jgi:transcription regulator MmyB-like protein